MISIGQQIRLLIEEKKKNADFSMRKLSQGLCSRDTFAGLLEGSDITDPRFLKIIFQRLGKSPNKLEHIVPKSFIEITKLQYDFDDSIDRRDSENARTLMQEIEKFAPTCSFAKIRLMYIHRNRAAYEYYINGDPDTALEEIKAVINITLPKVSAENFANYAVSSVEMENILFYCLMLLESGDSNLDNNSFVRCFLGSLKDYAASNTTDPEEFAAIMPKIKWLSACLCLLEHRESEAVKECSDGLELLREHALLQMSLPFLEVITKHGKNTGLPNNFEDYASFKELLERLNDKYMSPKAHFDSLFFNTERAIYHYEAEVYSAQRKITKRTQEDIAGCVDVEPNVISRYEKGRRSPGKNTFPSLMAALELDRTRQGTFLICSDFKTLEQERQFVNLYLKGDYEGAAKILDEVDEQLDNRYRLNSLWVSLRRNQLAVVKGTLALEVLLEKDLALLEEVYPLSEPVIERPPFLIESSLIAQICYCYQALNRYSEEVALCEKVVSICNKSFVDGRLQERIFGLHLNGLATLSGKDSFIACIKYQFSCRDCSNLDALFGNYSSHIYNHNYELSRELAYDGLTMARFLKNRNDTGFLTYINEYFSDQGLSRG